MPCDCESRVLVFVLEREIIYFPFGHIQSPLANRRLRSVLCASSLARETSYCGFNYSCSMVIPFPPCPFSVHFVLQLLSRMLPARIYSLCHVPHWMCVCMLGDTWCTVGLLSLMTGVLCVISCKDNVHNCVYAYIAGGLVQQCSSFI
jgi:hypothetical protein